VPLPYANTNTSGNPADATTVVLTVTLPDQTTVTPAVTHAGTGQYSATYITTQAGHHLVTWVATDATAPGSQTDSFDVWPLGEMAILPFADAKRALRIPATDTQEDDFVRECNEAVTNAVEWLCGPVLVQTVVEVLRVGGLTVMLSKIPVISLVAWASLPPGLPSGTFTVSMANSGPMFPMLVYGVTYPLNQLVVDQKRGEVRHSAGLPFYYGPFFWQYTAGRAVIPQCITYGARAMLRHLYEMERGGTGGLSVGSADEETIQTPFGFAIPNRVVEMLAPEALPGAIA
jgi:hypothetical protein